MKTLRITAKQKGLDAVVELRQRFQHLLTPDVLLAEPDMNELSDDNYYQAITLGTIKDDLLNLLESDKELGSAFEVREQNIDETGQNRGTVVGVQIFPPIVESSEKIVASALDSVRGQGVKTDDKSSVTNITNAQDSLEETLARIKYNREHGLPDDYVESQATNDSQTPNKSAESTVEQTSELTEESKSVDTKLNVVKPTPSVVKNESRNESNASLVAGLLPTSDDITKHLTADLPIEQQPESPMAKMAINLNQVNINNMYAEKASQFSELDYSELEKELRAYQQKVQEHPPAEVISYLNAHKNVVDFEKTAEKTIEELSVQYERDYEKWLDNRLPELREDYVTQYPDRTEQNINDFKAQLQPDIDKLKNDEIMKRKLATTALLRDFTRSNKNASLSAALYYVSAKLQTMEMMEDNIKQFDEDYRKQQQFMYQQPQQTVVANENESPVVEEETIVENQFPVDTTELSLEQTFTDGQQIIPQEFIATMPMPSDEDAQTDYHETEPYDNEEHAQDPIDMSALSDEELRNLIFKDEDASNGYNDTTSVEQGSAHESSEFSYPQATEFDSAQFGVTSEHPTIPDDLTPEPDIRDHTQRLPQQLVTDDMLKDGLDEELPDVDENGEIIEPYDSALDDAMFDDDDYDGPTNVGYVGTEVETQQLDGDDLLIEDALYNDDEEPTGNEFDGVHDGDDTEIESIDDDDLTPKERAKQEKAIKKAEKAKAKAEKKANSKPIKKWQIFTLIGVLLLLITGTVGYVALTISSNNATTQASASASSSEKAEKVKAFVARAEAVGLSAGQKIKITINGTEQNVTVKSFDDSANMTVETEDGQSITIAYSSVLKKVQELESANGTSETTVAETTTAQQ